MNQENLNLNNFSKLIRFYQTNNLLFIPNFSSINIDNPNLFKKGGSIKIKKKNIGSFTRYCGGNVTSECIRRGKNSPDPKIRKKATFAANTRKWKHRSGGIILKYNIDKLNLLLEGLKRNA